MKTPLLPARVARRLRPAGMALASGWALLMAASAAAPAAEDEKVDIDEQYVHSHLEGYLHPDAIEFKDGYVKMSFSFANQNPDRKDVFTPPVGKESDTKSRFRWARYDWRGLRMSNRGNALLNCWFQDDIEVEITYWQYMNLQDRHIFALIFANEKGVALGNNYGSQCVTFSKSGKMTGRQGVREKTITWRSLKMKLVVRGGQFAAHANGREQASMKYPEKRFSSGRLGFLWGGSVGGFVSQMEVKGKLDMEKMSKLLRKARRN